jgi:PHP family Zn ribbon phosphoesterase
VGVHSKQVRKEYEGLLATIGSEFKILLDASLSDLQEATIPEIAHAISCVREGNIRIEPGYDGEYGKISLHPSEKEAPLTHQQNLL